jgi:glycosyltransferase involved in cell wall biosynthesis
MNHLEREVPLSNGADAVKVVVYVERAAFEGGMSIEKVFRQVAARLSPLRFRTRFQKVAFANGLSSLVKNLISFRKAPADIYHITGEIHYLSLILPPDKTVLTIHDLRFLYDRKGIRRWVLKKLYLDWPIKRLRYITAVSEATRAEIVRHTGCDERLITVIENPVRDEFVSSVVKPFDKSRPTILQVGWTENKNIPNLAKAIEGLPCRLVVIGPIDDSISSVLRKHGIDFENKRALTDDGLRAEYENCDIVAFCSTYEGFGLPIIEAQAAGKPLVTSDLSPMKEIAGDGALLADAADPRSIRYAIDRLIADDELRAKITLAGRKNVQRFSPAAIAAEYAALYETISGNDR